jgi:dipeptidyl aminopeptidase/acylaminoacyl peptidase
MKSSVFFLLLFHFLSCCFVAFGQDLTPLDVSRIQYVSWFDVSSDAKHVAYGLSVPADPMVENKSPEFHLYQLNVESGQSTALVSDQTVRTGMFRPNSQTITFLAADSNKNTIIYQIPASGGTASELFSFESSISGYRWSNNGDKLLFTARDQVEKSEAPYEPEIYEEHLAFTRAYVLDINSGQTRRIPLEGSVYSFKWSPDDSKIAISTSPTPLVDDFYVKQQISIIDAQAFEEIGTVDHQAKLGPFCWNPESTELAMIAGANINDPIDGRLFVVSETGGAPKPLLQDFEGKFDQVQWTEEQGLLVLASVGTQSKLLSVNPSNFKIKQVSASEEGEAVWTDFEAVEKLIISTASNFNHPPELFVTSDGQTRRLTESNPWLVERSFGDQRVVRYPARDGLQIEGVLVVPNQIPEGVKLPLITVVHGGPESHFDNSWLTGYSTFGHVGAANGYAVFYPNYRGSTGRGIEFTLSSQGDQGGKEFDDIVDGVDYLIESGLIDKSRVGVTGGSYGGYATGWLSTKYSDRFAAGVMFVGISDHISKWGTSDIPEEMYNVHARSRVWDDYEYWLKRSPIYYADQTNTPLLIMHGKNDTRVHPSQSMELYRHIKTRTDTPVRLVFYPGEGHGNRKSTARLDYNLRSLRWFNYYLKDEQTDLDTKLELDR